MKLLPKKRPQAVLALSLEGGMLRAQLVARAREGYAVEKAVSASLTLDPMQHELALVARELRNHLDGAGIRESACVVLLPAAWAMTQHIRLPELSPEDLAGFLSLEAEKGFPCPPEQLQIEQSRQEKEGARFATQIAVRRESLERLLAVLRAAKLKPCSLSFGLPALPDAVPDSGSGRVVVEAGPSGTTLLLSAGGGIAAFRTCDAVIESEAGERIPSPASINRELRITLEQLPEELRRDMRDLHVLGDEDFAGKISAGLSAWAASAGLRIAPAEPRERKHEERVAVALAAQWLERGRAALEFLPPKPSRYEQLMARYSSKRLATVGFTLGAALALVAVAFAVQIAWSWTLSGEWSGMRAQVSELDGVQKRIREYRPWYDTRFGSLSVLQKVTEAFPENGSVTAKTLEIKNGSTVTITGVTRDNASLLKVLDRLRKLDEVSNLKVDQIRGKSPIQFTFNFQWRGAQGT